MPPRMLFRCRAGDFFPGFTEGHASLEPRTILGAENTEAVFAKSENVGRTTRGMGAESRPVVVERHTSASAAATTNRVR
jgi:hypothetical protein